MASRCLHIDLTALLLSRDTRFRSRIIFFSLRSATRTHFFSLAWHHQRLQPLNLVFYCFFSEGLPHVPPSRRIIKAPFKLLCCLLRNLSILVLIIPARSFAAPSLARLCRVLCRRSIFISALMFGLFWKTGARNPPSRRSARWPLCSSAISWIFRLLVNSW